MYFLECDDSTAFPTTRLDGRLVELKTTVEPVERKRCRATALRRIEVMQRGCEKTQISIAACRSTARRLWNRRARLYYIGRVGPSRPRQFWRRGRRLSARKAGCTRRCS